MPINQRFVLNENRDVIDMFNPDGPKGYCHEGSPESQIYLRESILSVRLGKLVDDLIIIQPDQKSPGGELCYERHSILRPLWAAILASSLNTLTPSMSVHEVSTKNLRQKEGWQAFTSLSRFRDDVERLLRDMYGDTDSEALDRILYAAFAIVEEFARYIRKDLWQEHKDAMDFDYIYWINVPEGYDLGGTELRRGLMACDNLKVRAREVLKDPTAFSKYTVQFANEWEESGESVFTESSKADDEIISTEQVTQHTMRGEPRVPKSIPISLQDGTFSAAADADWSVDAEITAAKGCPLCEVHRKTFAHFEDFGF
jgi:hypothetical protein